MTPNRPDLSSNVLRGATVSVEYHNSQSILRSEQKNPQVVYEIYADEPGVLCGVNEVISLLHSRLPGEFSSVFALSDGDQVSTGETVMSVEAPYSAFGLYRDVAVGILASCTGWANAADRCVRAADGVRVVIAASSHIHPEVVGSLEHSAYVAGCAAVSTQIGGELTSTVPLGSMSPEYVLIWGSASRAIMLYDRNTRIGSPRVLPVPTTADPVQEALDAAYALSSPQGNRLRAVRLNIPPNLGGGSPAYAVELKSRLSDAGFDTVEIQISGNLTPELIAEYVAADAPVSLFVVGSYVASSPAARFSSGIKEIDGKAVAVRGMTPGRVPNPRLAAIDMVI